MIPMNVIDIDAVNAERAAKFAHEVDVLETTVFKQEWTSRIGGSVRGYMNVTPFINVRFWKELTGKDPIYLGEDHWNALVEHAKAAGYCVYRKWYHNGYYGTTEKHALYITRTPFTSAEIERLELLPTWGTPWGLGRESFRGERL